MCQQFHILPALLPSGTTQAPSHSLNYHFRCWGGETHLNFPLSCLLSSASLAFLRSLHLSLTTLFLQHVGVSLAEASFPPSPAWRVTRSAATPGAMWHRRRHSSPPICAAILSKHFLAETANYHVLFLLHSLDDNGRMMLRDLSPFLSRCLFTIIITSWTSWHLTLSNQIVINLG